MMYELLSEFFSKDALGQYKITLFSIYHIIYVLIILGACALAIYLTRNKDQAFKEKVLKVYARIALGLYILDFFIMPFSEGEIDITKLPFHICTLLSPFVVLSCYHETFKKLRTPIAVLALVSSLMYLTYPGSAIDNESAFCYTVIQTFLFHGVMLNFGILSLAYRFAKPEWKNIYYELVIITLVALWATIGNYAYSTSEHSHDWFFVNGNTFPFIPKPLMPFTVIAAIFAMVAIIYSIYFGIKKIIDKKGLN